MSFTVSKLIEQFLIPSNFLLLIGLLGVVLLVIGRRKSGAVLASLSLVLMAVCGWSMVGSLALAPLENRFPVPQITQPPTGIVMLGGAVEIHITGDRKAVTVNNGAERLLETASLARQYPNARVFLSGGLGHGEGEDATPSESSVARQFLIAVGVAPERIAMDEKSRTTCENAAESAKALNPKPGETWLLVTSGWHLPRAVNCFRAEKFEVIPYPVDYRTRVNRPWRIVNRSTAEGFEIIDIAFHEWIGLVAYWLSGKTTEILPS